jgi:hypothetical protein
LQGSEEGDGSKTTVGFFCFFLLQQKKEGNATLLLSPFFFLFGCSSAKKAMATKLPSLSPSFFL